MIRVACLALLIAAAAIPAAWAAPIARPPAGTVSIEGAKGVVVIRGVGTVIGRVSRGDVQVTDLTPADAWVPKLNGAASSKLLQQRGRDLNFFVPGGRYRIVIKGEGVSLSARGVGVVTVKGARATDNSGATVAVGDAAPAPLPADGTRITFGGYTGA
ncbi:MAG: hypothetical protein U0R50_12045 [Gaiellales bacterium]